MKELILTFSLLTISLLSLDAYSCNGHGWANTYVQANQMALRDCAAAEQATKNRCHVNGQGFNSTGCIIGGTWKDNYGSYRANAYAMNCRCEGIKPKATYARRCGRIVKMYHTCGCMSPKYFYGATLEEAWRACDQARNYNNNLYCHDTGEYANCK